MKKIATVLFVLAFLMPVIAGSSHAQEEMSKKEKAQLFRKGAQLWPVYCAQCHNPRAPGEYSSYQWDIVMAHMRTLGNIPPGDANAILAYLKGGS
jgi:mono/diheme cytochrome c family protein